MSGWSPRSAPRFALVASALVVTGAVHTPVRRYHFAVHEIDARGVAKTVRTTPTGVQALAAFDRSDGSLSVAGADDNPTGRLRGKVVFVRYP